MATERASVKKVNISPLRAFASKLPKDNALRAIMTVEPDEMSPEELSHKMGTWLRLISRVDGGGVDD